MVSLFVIQTPYNTNNTWTMAVEKRDGCLFLDVRRTDDEMERNGRIPVQQSKAMYAGRRFELYATAPADSTDSKSESAITTSDSSRRVDQENEYCALFAVKMGGIAMAVGAEIDCFETVERERSYVELKTARVLRSDKDRFVFERYKLLACWIQSFVVGTPTIVFGFRDDDFQLRKVQRFRTTDIPSFCHKHWDPQVCLQFATSLLRWVMDQAAEGHVYELTYRPRDHEVVLARRDAWSSFLPREAEATASHSA
ncbi:hypothetical protein PINS_up001356 [Pythium insidiosum]|nr:hypothetical protein PINS_up001356 [Pythium insidiosum]